MRKGYLETTYGQLHYRTAGKPDAAPLVLLHQTASSSLMYMALMRELQDTYWVIAPDTPGFGASFLPATRGTMVLYANAIWQGLRQLSVQSCRLFGHHTGAAIAVQMTHDHPECVHQLVLCGPPLLAAEKKLDLAHSLPAWTLHEDGRHQLSIWQRIRQKDANASLELIQREVLLALLAGAQAKDAYQAVFEQAFAAQLSTIACPTLVLTGTADSLAASAEPAARLLPEGTLQFLPGAGTFICDTHTVQLAQQLRHYFDTAPMGMGQRS